MYKPFIDRIVHAARTSRLPLDRFDFLSAEMNEMSGVVAACTAQISILHDNDLVQSCRFYEEMDGRINTDNLNRVVVLGGPYFIFKQGDKIQDILKAQVKIGTCSCFRNHVRRE